MECWIHLLLYFIYMSAELKYLKLFNLFTASSLLKQLMNSTAVYFAPTFHKYDFREVNRFTVLAEMCTSIKWRICEWWRSIKQSAGWSSSVGSLSKPCVSDSMPGFCNANSFVRNVSKSNPDNIIRIIFSRLDGAPTGDFIQLFSHTVPWLINQLDMWKQWRAPLRPQITATFVAFHCVNVAAVVLKCSDLSFSYCCIHT